MLRKVDFKELDVSTILAKTTMVDTGSCWGVIKVVESLQNAQWYISYWKDDKRFEHSFLCPLLKKFVEKRRIERMEKAKKEDQGIFE
jgi:hypothetical protein